MADRQRKLKDKASRAYADGKFKEALKLYLKVTELDPTELGCQLKIGDIYRRLNDRDAAVKVYLPVARAYAGDGLMLKAIAVCKMALAVDSAHGPTQTLLQKLSQKRRGSPVEAPAPVTLQGMGISPTAQGEASHLQNYGMVEFGTAGSQGRRSVITGTPVAPPAAAPAIDMATRAASDTATASTPPHAAEARAVGAVSWPVGASTGHVVLGARVEGPPEGVAADGREKGGREALVAARQVEAEMAGLSADVEAKPGGDGDLELPDDELIVLGDAPLPIETSEDENEGAISLELEVPSELSTAAAAVVGDDEPLSIEADEEASTPGVDHDAPIELTEALPSSRRFSGPVNTAVGTEDIDLSHEAGEVDGEELSKTKIPLFSELPKNAFIELLVHMDMRELAPGSVVIEEGQVGDSFFVLVSGRVQVLRRDDSGKDTVLAYLAEGAFFGEMALLQDGARTATVVTETECQIFEISREVLDRVVSSYPSVANVLRNFYRQRLLSTTMATHPVFRPFSRKVRRELMEQFKSRSFKSGDVLVQEGKKGKGLFLLLYGGLAVFRGEQEAPRHIAELSSGDLFGEMSLLTNRPTMASVRAMTDCFVLRMSKKKFDEIIMTHPQILELVSRISAERQELNDLVLSEGPGSGVVLV